MHTICGVLPKAGHTQLDMLHLECVSLCIERAREHVGLNAIARFHVQHMTTETKTRLVDRI